MVESLDNPKCLFPILGFQFRGINGKPEKCIVSFGQINAESLWPFSDTSAPEDLLLNFYGSCFPNSRPRDGDCEYAIQNWSQQETA